MKQIPRHRLQKYDTQALGMLLLGQVYNEFKNDSVAGAKAWATRMELDMFGLSRAKQP